MVLQQVQKLYYINDIWEKFYYEYLIKKIMSLQNLNLQFFFYSPKSLFFIKGISGIFIVKLPRKYYYFDYENGFYFFFTNKFFFKNFISHLYLNINQTFFFYFAKLRLRGLGYRFRKMTRHLYRIFMGQTNYIYFHVPTNVYVKLRRRRAFFLCSNLNLLRNVIIHFLLLKE